eukprot:scaffold10143_cov119-Skeletonema_dohrnii-CCMP3373.AAC.10
MSSSEFAHAGSEFAQGGGKWEVGCLCRVFQLLIIKVLPSARRRRAPSPFVQTLPPHFTTKLPNDFGLWVSCGSKLLFYIPTYLDLNPDYLLGTTWKKGHRSHVSCKTDQH